MPTKTPRHVYPLYTCLTGFDSRRWFWLGSILRRQMKLYFLYVDAKIYTHHKETTRYSIYSWTISRCMCVITRNNSSRPAPHNPRPLTAYLSRRGTRSLVSCQPFTIAAFGSYLQGEFHYQTLVSVMENRALPWSDDHIRRACPVVWYDLQLTDGFVFFDVFFVLLLRIRGG